MKEFPTKKNGWEMTEITSVKEGMLQVS